MKSVFRLLLLLVGLLASSNIRADGPEMSASISGAHIPNKSPTGNTSYGLTIVVTISNPSDQPMLFDVYESFWIKVLDAKKNVIADSYVPSAPLPPAMRDVVRLQPRLAYSRAYNLNLRDGALTMDDGTGTVHQFVLPKAGEYTIEASFKSNPNQPLIADFENSNYQTLINEFYRGPFKLGRFRIKIGDLNKQPAGR